MSEKTNNEPTKELSPLALELIASRFRALSEPVRLRLLNLLMQGDHTVGQLVAASGSGQANVSKHLSVLREAGMIGMRKEGPATVCYIADPLVKNLCDMMCSRLREEIETKAAALAFDPKI
ncbi:MAG: winged helix-turn-helix transcriptional regulator [Gloeobacteraceae cyanobacterium ES-bin-144]|nr:winged helix-turn-helix transcriptional regulator [Verrucomicrobiales bacterium]